MWNLGFVEAHQNSILRGQGFLSTRGGWKGRAAFPHRQLARKQSRRQKSAVHEQRQEKALKRSRTVVAVFKYDRFFVWADRDRDVYPTCPTLRGMSREKPTTSTTTTGRTIVETIQRRDQLPHQQRKGTRSRRPPHRSWGRRGGKQHWRLQ